MATSAVKKKIWVFIYRNGRELPLTQQERKKYKLQEMGGENIGLERISFNITQNSSKPTFKQSCNTVCSVHSEILLLRKKNLNKNWVAVLEKWFSHSVIKIPKPQSKQGYLMALYLEYLH